MNHHKKQNALVFRAMLPFIVRFSALQREDENVCHHTFSVANQQDHHKRSPSSKTSTEPATGNLFPNEMISTTNIQHINVYGEAQHFNHEGAFISVSSNEIHSPSLQLLTAQWIMFLKMMGDSNQGNQELLKKTSLTESKTQDGMKHCYQETDSTEQSLDHSQQHSLKTTSTSSSFPVVTASTHLDTHSTSCLQQVPSPPFPSHSHMVQHSQAKSKVEKVDRCHVNHVTNSVCKSNEQKLCRAHTKGIQKRPCRQKKQPSIVPTSFMSEFLAQKEGAIFVEHTEEMLKQQIMMSQGLIPKRPRGRPRKNKLVEDNSGSNKSK